MVGDSETPKRPCASPGEQVWRVLKDLGFTVDQNSLSKTECHWTVLFIQAGKKASSKRSDSRFGKISFSEVAKFGNNTISPWDEIVNPQWRSWTDWTRVKLWCCLESTLQRKCKRPDLKFVDIALEQCLWHFKFCGARPDKNIARTILDPFLGLGIQSRWSIAFI